MNVYLVLALCFVPYVLMFVMFFVCNKASINQGYLTPFCFGPYYALIFKGGAVLGCSIIFAVAFMMRKLIQK